MNRIYCAALMGLFFTAAVAVIAQDKQLTGVDKINAAYQERLRHLQQGHQLTNANLNIAQQVAQQIRDAELARYNRQLEQARITAERETASARYRAQRRQLDLEASSESRRSLAAGKIHEPEQATSGEPGKGAALSPAPATVSPATPITASPIAPTPPMEPPPVKTGINYNTNGSSPNLALDPVVITSIGCIGDFVKMKSLEGVAQRKLFADLMQFGCVVTLKGIYFVPTLRGANIIRGGQTFIKTMPLVAVAKMEQVGLNVYADLDLFDSVTDQLIDRHLGYVPSTSLVSEHTLDADLKLNK